MAVFFTRLSRKSSTIYNYSADSTTLQIPLIISPQLTCQGQGFHPLHSHTFKASAASFSPLHFWHLLHRTCVTGLTPNHVTCCPKDMHHENRNHVQHAEKSTQTPPNPYSTQLSNSPFHNTPQRGKAFTFTHQRPGKKGTKRFIHPRAHSRHKHEGQPKIILKVYQILKFLNMPHKSGPKSQKHQQQPAYFQYAKNGLLILMLCKRWSGHKV